METTKIRLAFDNMAKQFCSDYLYDGRKDYRGYRATGAGNFEMFRDCKHIREISLEVSDMIINYIFEKRYITVEETRSIVTLNSI